jgi:hypothetical protein
MQSTEVLVDTNIGFVRPRRGQTLSYRRCSNFCHP